MGAETSDVGVGSSEPAFSVRSYLAPEDRPATPEQRLALHDASRDALKHTGDILDRSVTWAEADQHIGALLARQTEPIRRRVFEVAATRMLQPDVLPVQASPEASDASGRYAEMLVRHGSPDVPLIASALERAAQSWEPDRVAVLASDALSGFEAYKARGACDGCRPTARLSASAPLRAAELGSEAAYEAKVQEAVARLRALAGHAAG